MRVVFLSLALLAAPALAAPQSHSATLGPVETLKARDADIRAVLPPPGQEPNAQTKDKLETAVLDAVDVEAMAKDALGKNWAEQPSGKRKKFIEAFRNRFKKATGQQLDLYRAAKTEYGAPQKVSDDEMKVPTQLTVKGEPTEVAYVMRKEPKGWRIVDIVVDGVSTIQNYRSTFNKVIAKEGFDGLISRLQNAAGDEKSSDQKSSGKGGSGSAGGGASH